MMMMNFSSIISPIYCYIMRDLREGRHHVPCGVLYVNGEQLNQRAVVRRLKNDQLWTRRTHDTARKVYATSFL